jgi:hypothetical protein
VEFEAAVNDGVLRPDIERDEVMALKGERHARNAKTKAEAKAKGTVLISILLRKDEIEPSDLQLLKSVAKSLLNRPSVTVEPSLAWKRLLAKSNSPNPPRQRSNGLD